MDYILIPLSVKRYFHKNAKADREFSYLKDYTWHISNSGYATAWSCNHKKNMAMHVMIMEKILDRKLRHSEVVDHINGDKLDNRSQNLRAVSPSENSRNVTHPIKRRASRIIDTLYLNMKARGDPYLSFADAAILMEVSKTRMLQLKASIEEDPRFKIVPAPRQRVKLFITLNSD